MFLKMAILSVLRRPKRAVLIMMAVALSVFVMEFVSGWVEGMRDRMHRQILEETAHILAETKARRESLDPLEAVDYIPASDAGAIVERLRSDDRVAAVERMSVFGALILSGQKNLPLKVYGVTSDTGYFSQVGKGRLEGAFPFAGPGIAVSRKALELVGASDAKRLVILVEDAYGAPAYRELPIACVFSTDDTSFDASTAFIDRESAAALLGTDDTAELWVRLKNPDDAPAVAGSLGPLLSGRGVIARIWIEMQGTMLVMIKFMEYFMFIINVIVLVVVATVITNAILMNVFEKQHEYGTLRAIGMKRREQAFLVLLEGAAQGVIGAVIGVLLALPVVLYFRRYGLPIGEASRVFGSGDVMYFGTNPLVSLQNMAVGALIAVAGSVYAALVGTRSAVVDAIKGA